jgi:2-polyprenyl-3-methyl-5-hydroxy-6-metoxy-1,4-benzoquinol methylase
MILRTAILDMPDAKLIIDNMFQSTVADRMTVIERCVRQGDVLDIGCVDARTARESSASRIEHKPNMLLKRIVELNPRTLGVDIDSEGVQALRAMKFDVICEDAETMDLNRQFDTIVAGELIEHLENPGRWLRNMRRHLKDQGVIIISTPNPFYCGQTWKVWRYGKPAVHEDHVNWQDPITLAELLRRTGFELVEGYWVQPKSSILKSWKRLLRGYFSHTFMVVARPKITK